MARPTATSAWIGRHLWVAVVLPAALAGSLGEPASASGGSPPIQRLSNERTRTVAAHVTRPAWVRSRPRVGSRKVARLRTRTFTGSREVVLVIARTSAADGRSWALVRYPGLGWRRGWMPERALADLTVVRTLLVIDRKRQRARLHRRGRPVFVARLGVGAPSSPTPAGRYYVREKLIPTERGGIYGALAFGISAYSPFRTDWPGGGQVGIHGTNQPGLIPGRISNGCVRMNNRAIRRLDRLMPVGTPIRIR